MVFGITGAGGIEESSLSHSYTVKMNTKVAIFLKIRRGETKAHLQNHVFKHKYWSI
jgi:hypothetical protein